MKKKFDFSQCIKFNVWRKIRFTVEAETEEEAREEAKKYAYMDVERFPELEPANAEYFNSYMKLMQNKIEPTIEIRDFMTDELIADNAVLPVEKEEEREWTETVEYVVVNVSERLTSAYTIEKEKQKADIKRIKAQEKAMEDVLKFKEYAEKYPGNSDYWLRQAEKAERAVFEVMTFDEYLQKQREEVLSLPVQESTEEEFFEQLGVLPPFCHGTLGGMELFCMSEFDFGPYTAQYAKDGDKYYFATVDAFDQSTWIPNRLPQ